MRSAAITPDAYLDQLPPDRRAALAAVRDVIRANLPNGYEEAMGSGMIVYGVPTTRLILPNKQALWYAALGAQKNYNSLYLMSVYANKTQLQRLRDAFAKAGKKLDMGKSCIHFQHADDLQLEAIGQAIASVPVEKWISIFNESRRKPSSRKNA